MVRTGGSSICYTTNHLTEDVVRISLSPQYAMEVHDHRRLQTRASPGFARVENFNRKHDVILISSY